MSETLCGRIADFAAGMTLDDAPPEVQWAATRALADTLACAIAAASEPEGGAVDVVRGYALEFAKRDEATIIGTSWRSDLRSAALANCAMARYLDANDIYMPPAGSLSGSGHFSDAVPAVLAAAEMTEATGAEAIEAVIVAYEVQAALADSFPWLERGFHSVSQVTVATALAAGRLMGLDEERLLHAGSLAVTSGLMLQSWLHPATQVPAIKGGAPGFAGERGILCAELAGMGFTGPPDALETFFRFFGDGEPDVTAFERLGEEWTLPRNAIKPAPAQIFTQAIIQCAAELYCQGLRLDAFDALTVRSNEGACGRVQGSPAAFEPASREAADHSTPFVVAMTLRNGEVTPASYAGSPWLDRDVRDAMRRMDLVIDPAWEARRRDSGLLGGEIEARDRDGRVYRAEVSQFRGHPANPLSDDELVAKLEAFIGRPEILGAGAGERLMDHCAALVDEPAIHSLVDFWKLDR